MTAVIKSIGGRDVDGRDRPLLGQLLKAAGKLSDDGIERVIHLQGEMKLQFGESAVRLGLVQQADILRALSEQFSYHYARLDGEKLNPQLVAAVRPFSAQAEALRTLRSQLLLRWFRQGHKSLAILAARSASGASSIAANLSILFAQMGTRTLLIDANLRRPALHGLFGINHAYKGLAELLSDRCSWPQALIPVEPFENLSVLCAGTMPPNPQELLSKPAMEQLFAMAAASFDVVLLDTAPLLEFSDAQIVAAQAGGCVLVVQRNRTRVSDLKRAHAELEPTRATVLGAVMNS